MIKKATVILVVSGVVAFLIFASSNFQNIFLTLIEGVENLGESHTTTLFVLFVTLAAFSAMLSPFSTIPLVPVAVAIWGTSITAGLLLVGWIFGDVLAYIVGKYTAHPLLKHFLDEEKLTAYEESFRGRMTFTRALVVRLALPAEIGYGFGIIRYGFVRYLLITLIAEIPYALITVQAGEAFATFQAIPFLGWVLLLILMLGIFYAVMKKTQKKRVS